MYEDLLYGFYSLLFKFSGKVLPVILILLFLFCFFFFLVILFRVGSFIRSLTCGSSFSLTWNLGSLLDLSSVQVFSQARLPVLDYRWSQNLPTYRRTVTPNWYRTRTFPKFDL